MKLEGVLPFARKLLEKAVGGGGAAVDATMGNGHDTLFLAKLVGSSGKVFAFDVQAGALECAEVRQACTSEITPVISVNLKSGFSRPDILQD